MNESLAIELIHQRMKQMNVGNYHLEPFSLYVFLTYDTHLSNEWWYLLGHPASVSISSDTAYYRHEATEINRSNVAEFTGNISIRTTSVDIKTVTLDFIRVIINTGSSHE